MVESDHEMIISYCHAISLKVLQKTAEHLKVASVPLEIRIRHLAAYKTKGTA